MGPGRCCKVDFRYKVLYSYYRRLCLREYVRLDVIWRLITLRRSLPGRPLILPIYISSPGFNFVTMSSYDHRVLSPAYSPLGIPIRQLKRGPPFCKGLADELANVLLLCSEPSSAVVTPLPRAGLALVLLLSFFSPENLPGGLSLSGVDQSTSCHDRAFFDKNTGALSAYAKGVLVAIVAWATWRTLILLLSWCVAFLPFL